MPPPDTPSPQPNSGPRPPAEPIEVNTTWLQAAQQGQVLEAADVVTAANTDDGVALLLERILQANGGESAFGRR
jgi:hypothetical protein